LRRTRAGGCPNGLDPAAVDLFSGRDDAHEQLAVVAGEVNIGIDEGLKRDSAVNLDHVQTVDKTRLHRYPGSLSAATMTDACEALVIATGCDR